MGSVRSSVFDGNSEIDLLRLFGKYRSHKMVGASRSQGQLTKYSVNAKHGRQVDARQVRSLSAVGEGQASRPPCHVRPAGVGDLRGYEGMYYNKASGLVAAFNIVAVVR